MKLTKVATLNQPLAFAQAAGDDAFYVAEKGGRVEAVRNGATSMVLDISNKVSTGGEQGLLGIAFTPDGSTMVVSYTDSGNDVHVDTYPFAGGRIAGGAHQLALINHPYANHNGGDLVFGPDGYLYLGMGDGGSEGDPNNRGQNPSDPLGKMLRIDPATGHIDIWMIGLRNPWRFSFDRQTNDVWIGDVGQDTWEEIDFAPAGTHGQNWGWSIREGRHPYKGTTTAGLTDPIYEYSHSGGGCAVTGGYVYRGSALTGWQGTYVFADECLGEVMALRRSGDTARDTGLSASQLASFGQDRNGELYVLSLAGGVYRIDRA